MKVPPYEVGKRWSGQIWDRRADLSAPAVFGMKAVSCHQALDALVAHKPRSASSSVILGDP
jgi:hypothetical protein